MVININNFFNLRDKTSTIGEFQDLDHIEGVAVSSFADKSNLSEDEYKNAILGTGFEVVKVISVDGIITDAEEARKLVD